MINREETIELGTRRELFVDDYLIETWTQDVAVNLHHPAPREIVLETDRPWEVACPRTSVSSRMITSFACITAAGSSSWRSLRQMAKDFSSRT